MCIVDKTYERPVDINKDQTESGITCWLEGNQHLRIWRLLNSTQEVWVKTNRQRRHTDFELAVLHVFRSQVSDKSSPLVIFHERQVASVFRDSEAPSSQPPPPHYQWQWQKWWHTWTQGNTTLTGWIGAFRRTEGIKRLKKESSRLVWGMFLHHWQTFSINDFQQSSGYWLMLKRLLYFVGVAAALSRVSPKSSLLCWKKIASFCRVSCLVLNVEDKRGKKNIGTCPTAVNVTFHRTVIRQTGCLIVYYSSNTPISHNIKTTTQHSERSWYRRIRNQETGNRRNMPVTPETYCVCRSSRLASLRVCWAPTCPNAAEGQRRIRAWARDNGAMQWGQ